MTFFFLNESRRISSRPWGESVPSRLWRFNVHYFDDLNAFNAEARHGWHVEAIVNWIHDNPLANDDGWAPYPTSLRVVNWIKWALSGGILERLAEISLAMQIRMLAERLEYHLLGNHLFANAKALVFAGVFFEGREAERWLDVGMGILKREIQEQILIDGGQFERSTMYHAIALEDLLDLINVTTALSHGVPERWKPFVESWAAVARRMRRWLRAMCHPDGEIAFFNDAAIGIAPSLSEIERYGDEVIGPQGIAHIAAEFAPSIIHLQESGYIRADAGNATIFMDVAPVGPDYLPGHAHADTLSFELSLFGQRLIVNGGTSCYDRGAERDAERGTLAHSTVVVNGKNSSEVWASFRVARRARPFDLVVRRESEHLRVSCAHDGYRRLGGRPVHRRTWLFGARALRIEDHIEGRFKSAIARFHLHPAVDCTVDESRFSGYLRLPGAQVVHWRAVAGSVHLEPSLYRPEFGRRDPTQCLAMEFAGPAVCLELTWQN